MGVRILSTQVQDPLHCTVMLEAPRPGEPAAPPEHRDSKTQQDNLDKASEDGSQVGLHAEPPTTRSDPSGPHPSTAPTDAGAQRDMPLHNVSVQHLNDGDSSNAPQNDSAENPSALDPSNPDVQQQLRQQELTKLMWLYVCVLIPDRFQRMTNQRTILMQMRMTVTRTGMSPVHRNIQTATTNSEQKMECAGFTVAS